MGNSNFFAFGGHSEVTQGEIGWEVEDYDVPETKDGVSRTE